MNEALPPLWPPAHHGLVMLDSLAWLWPGPPPGVENAAAYFVQDYMVPADRIADWRRHHRIDLVGPIVSTDQDPMAVVDGNYVLLNFNGSSSFIQPQAWFERIIHTITESIATSPALGERKIVVATNGKVAASLAGKLGHQVLIANFPSQKMAALMRQADIILATPGITSTLEAFSLGLRIGLLPPLNYSQMLLSHQYYTRFGARSGLAPGNFGAEFTTPAGLPEAEGVARTMACVDELLQARLSDIRARVDAMLVGDHLLEPADMNVFRLAPELSAGADTIAARVLALATARAATAQRLR
jgi:hypothetical protein